MFTVRKIYYKRRHGLDPHHLDGWGTPIVPEVTPGNTRSVIFLRLLNSAILILAIIFSSHSHWVSEKGSGEFDIIDDNEMLFPLPDPWKELEDAPHIVLVGKAFIILSESLALSFSIIMIIHRLIVLDGANRNAELGMFLVAAVTLLISGCLECWYATGFNYMDHDGIDYTVWGWISAAIWLFIAALVASVDAFVSKKDLSILGTKVRQVPNPNFHRPTTIEEEQAVLNLERRELRQLYQ